MSTCKNCLKILVCKYNDGHNLFCKEDYKCPHFLDISAIEKQIPKKVKKEKSISVIPEFKPNGTILGKDVDTTTYYCPLCDGVLSIEYIVDRYHLEENFCSRCGQALDWGEME